MADKLAPYRGKRSAARTPEPVPPEGPVPSGGDDTFVIQEHHARALHWDFRLERAGVLVSWAIPKGLPTDPGKNHLAVQTEDHPLEYASFAGEIPQGEYGGGEVILWDRGTYECEKWSDREVMVVLHGSRAQGRYVLFRTDRRDRRGGDDQRNWMIHRMDPPAAGTQPLPTLIPPMLATLGTLPPHPATYGFEMKWDGVRAVGYVHGGRLRLMTRNDLDVTAAYPELRELGATLGALAVVLDGEIVAHDEHGRISFGALQPRMHVRNETQIRRLAEQTPVHYLVFDLLYLDGHPTTQLPYRQRRELLESLELHGPHWETPPYVEGDGEAMLTTSREQGLEGVVAKRLDSPYLPGRRSTDWIKVKHSRTQEVVIGGWTPGQGRREGTLGALLLGIPGPDGLAYAGQVGTGFTESMLDDLRRRLDASQRKTSPFADVVPAKDRRDARWVTPRLVGEVRYTEMTRDGRLRHPSWRGLRPDKSPGDVRREN